MGIRQRPDDGDGWVKIDLNRMSEPDKAEESEYSPHRDCLTLQKAQYGALTHTAGSVPVTVHNSRIVLKYYCKIKTSTTWAMNMQRKELLYNRLLFILKSIQHRIIAVNFLIYSQNIPNRTYPSKCPWHARGYEVIAVVVNTLTLPFLCSPHQAICICVQLRQRPSRPSVST